MFLLTQLTVVASALQEQETAQDFNGKHEVYANQTTYLQ